MKIQETESIIISKDYNMYACVDVRMCKCVRAWACVYACMRMHVCVHGWVWGVVYDYDYMF